MAKQPSKIHLQRRSQATPTQTAPSSWPTRRLRGALTRSYDSDNCAAFHVRTRRCGNDPSAVAPSSKLPSARPHKLWSASERTVARARRPNVGASAAGSPSSGVRGQPAPARADRTDAHAAQTISARPRTLRIGSRRTTSPRARSSKLPDGWFSHCVWSRADSASCRSTQCVRIGRSGANAATNRLTPGIRRSQSRSVSPPGRCRQLGYPRFSPLLISSALDLSGNRYQSR